jgi:hypothetical protein
MFTHHRLVGRAGEMASLVPSVSDGLMTSPYICYAFCMDGRISAISSSRSSRQLWPPGQAGFVATMPMQRKNVIRTQRLYQT